MKQIVARASSSLGYLSLKPEQERAILAFVNRRDAFVSLPTGYRKSFCFALLFREFDVMRNVKNTSVVIVVFPLIALMSEQVSNFSNKGISSVCVSDKDGSNCDKAVRCSIKKAEYQQVFISPEALFATLEWRWTLCSDQYRTNLVGFVVDETHCVKKMVIIIESVDSISRDEPDSP